jgi:hypothetical protein
MGEMRGVEALKRWATWPLAALLLLALVAAGAIVYAIHHEQGVKPTSFTDAVKNQRIIDQLTPYPGSRQTRKFVRSSYGGYGQGLLPDQEVTSHSTTVVYSLQADAKLKQVAAFYGRQLVGWKRQQDGGVFPCGSGPPAPATCFVRFTKGEAIVSISIDRRHKTISLLVDHQGATSGYYGGGD